MFSKTFGWITLQRNGTFPAINAWLEPWLAIRGMTGILALVCLAVPAAARTPYDGDWSVVITTQRGTCEPAFRYGIVIDNGVVTTRDSSAATVQGRVARNGAVDVSVQSGTQRAGGSGRLGRNRGSGVWQGQGSRGLCSGTWLATRRSYGPYATEPGPRRYNYGPETSGQGSAGGQGYEDEGSARDVAYCQSRFRSYDPATRTYLGRDGLRHRCP